LLFAGFVQAQISLAQVYLQPS